MYPAVVASGRPPFTLRALLVNPVIMFFSAFYAIIMPIGTALQQPSVAGWWLNRGQGPNLPIPGVTGPEGVAARFFVREPDGLRMLDPNNQSWDEATRVLAERPGDVLQLTFSRQTRAWGWWSPFLEFTTLSIDADPTLPGRTFTPAQREEARHRFLDDFGLGYLEPIGRLAGMRRGERNFTRVIWSGVRTNLTWLLAVAAFVYSLRWFPERRSARRRELLDRHLCPRCGYSTRGLPEPKCPECGETLDWPARAPSSP